MNEEPITDALLREFLLGKLDEAERERIESLFLTDTQAKERMLAAEQDLIEDYLEGNLTKEDKERFVSHYAQTDEQLRKLRITKSIKDWAVTEAKAPPVVAPPVSMWARLLQRPVFVLPVAAAIVLVVVLGLIWVNMRTEQQDHLALEQQLAQLNSPASLRETPQQMMSLDLSPVTVRSVEAQTGIKRSADVQLVELRLPWILRERYPAYRAELQRPYGAARVTIPNLQAENEGGYIRIRLPAGMLEYGQYQLELSGVAADGTPGLTERFTFIVTN
ncbi:MAG TPA: hypothetical protein VFR12_02715 [Pyrinomonadaceae bacterium]|nr:hypothetical protein [Pyrinomonadaceae bacterium]